MAYSSAPTTEDFELAQRAGELGLPFLALSGDDRLGGVHGLIAAYMRAGGRRSSIFGKPHPGFFRKAKAIAARHGRRTACVVGDRWRGRRRRERAGLPVAWLYGVSHGRSRASRRAPRDDNCPRGSARASHRPARRDGPHQQPRGLVRRRSRPPQGQWPLAPVAQLRRLVVVPARAVDARWRDAAVRVRLRNGREGPRRLERATAEASGPRRGPGARGACGVPARGSRLSSHSRILRACRPSGRLRCSGPGTRARHLDPHHRETRRPSRCGGPQRLMSDPRRIRGAGRTADPAPNPGSAPARTRSYQNARRSGKWCRARRGRRFASGRTCPCTSPTTRPSPGRRDRPPRAA